MTPTAAAPPRLYRRVAGQLFGGVAGGIAAHLGVAVWAVRGVFVVLAFYQGLAVVVYLLLWALLAPDQPTRPRGWFGRIWRGIGFGFGALTLSCVLWTVNDTGRILWLGSLVAIGVGAGLMWRAAGEDKRRHWEQQIPRFPLVAMLNSSGAASWVFRLAAGGLLVLVGLVGILAVSGELNAARQGLLFSVVTLAGVAIAAGPWLWRNAQELRTERSERIRSQERAEIAAIVHDKVLHTLALIQRAAGDSREVVRLARGQERELRNWLYKPAHSPTERLDAALEAIAAEVEDAYAVSIEVVLVGDAGMSPQVGAVVSAAREALVNAAKHANVASISLYAEVADGKIAVFVRDRGTGFDPNRIADDRHGVHGSIVARMRRHGGTAMVRSAVGAGTEIRLEMPLDQMAAAPIQTADGRGSAETPSR